ncbi:MAG: hypothetical protein M3022_00365 [Actinomycetota bacterium]|nr:hypothetical protein [Actinomycetota bacterium]
MTRFLSHTPFFSTVAAAGLRPDARASMTEIGLTVAKVPNPNALALRHAP